VIARRLLSATIVLLCLGVVGGVFYGIIVAENAIIRVLLFVCLFVCCLLFALIWFLCFRVSLEVEPHKINEQKYPFTWQCYQGKTMFLFCFSFPDSFSLFSRFFGSPFVWR
jgi:hypothetical protein